MSSRKALVTYEGAPALLNLDDPRALVARDPRPSRVVTRDRATTQRWALAIWPEQRWRGVAWWSHWHSEWGVAGLWEHTGLRVADLEVLSGDHPALVEAARLLNRPWQD